MELKLYAGMLIRRWRLVAGAFGITFLLTAILVSRQPWVYEATSTFVIRPSPLVTEAADDFVRAIDTLSRHTDINTTFSQVAGSKIVKQRAIERLDLSDEQRKGLQISGAAVAGSNILEISVRGSEPGIVRDMANAVGVETTEFIRSFYDVFELELLDEASFPSNPAGPNKSLTLAVGAMFGLMLGVALVFVAEYLQQPFSETSTFNIIDADSGFYNKNYFFLRLSQEMSRAENSEHTFSLVLIRLKSRRLATGITRAIPATKAAAPLLSALGPRIRQEDVLARVEDSLFALLLPAMSKEAADGLLEPLQEQVRSILAAQTNGVQGTGLRRTLEPGATVEIAAVAVTYTSTNLQESEKALFEHAVRQMGQEENDPRLESTTNSENTSGLIFLPGVERTRSKGRDTGLERRQAGG